MTLTKGLNLINHCSTCLLRCSPYAAYGITCLDSTKPHSGVNWNLTLPSCESTVLIRSKYHQWINCKNNYDLSSVQWVTFRWLLLATEYFYVVLLVLLLVYDVSLSSITGYCGCFFHLQFKPPLTGSLAETDIKGDLNIPPQNDKHHICEGLSS